MVVEDPVTELDARYGDGAEPTHWQAAVDALSAAEIFWLTTVRADGRPHVTPLIALWSQDAMFFCTGPEEQKARNLARHAACALVTGSNGLHGGLDLVVEGSASRVTDEATLHRVAEGYVAKYGEDWRFDVHDEAFRRGDSQVLVFTVEPVTAYGFGKGVYTQTRWTFPPPR